MKPGKAATILALAAGSMLAGCTMNGGPAAVAGSDRAASATAAMRTSDGREAGTAVATAEHGGVRVVIEAKALPPGLHGAHVHTVGRCDAPDFTTAGGHWNPMTTKHGSRNPAGPHAGDLPNLTVGSDGRGKLSMMLPAGTLDAMLDADGAALVVHATADDLMSDPAGNSGGRIACGVFTVG